MHPLEGAPQKCDAVSLAESCAKLSFRRFRDEKKPSSRGDPAPEKDARLFHIRFATRHERTIYVVESIDFSSHGRRTCDAR